MYTVGEEVFVPADEVRWPAYPNGFVGVISTVEEDWPAEPGSVWVTLTAVVNGMPGESQMTPLRMDLERVQRPSVLHGPPPGFRRVVFS